MNPRLFVSTIASIALSAAASAEVVVTTDFANSSSDTLNNPFTAKVNDLLSGLQPTASTGPFNVEGTGGIPVLTNDSNPAVLSRVQPNPTGFQFASFATGGNTAGLSLTYTLAEAASIMSIHVLGGWQDGGRDQQAYSIFYSTAAAPAVFLPLTTVNFQPGPLAPGNHPVATQVVVSDTTGTLATNVRALRFDFGTTENGYSGYSEIDVLPVPEPATVGLLGMAAVGLGFRRQRAHLA